MPSTERESSHRGGSAGAERGEIRSLPPALQRIVGRWLPRRGKSFRMAFFASVWLGAGGGGLLALVLWSAALLVQPTLWGRGNEAAWLLLDLLLVISNLGLVLVFLLLWPLLAWLKRRGGAGTEAVQLLAAVIPGTIVSLFIADTFGRHLLPRIAGEYWPPSIVAAAVAAGAGAALTLTLATLLAVARLRFGGHWRLGRLHHAERWLPFFMNATLATLLLHAGPYSSWRPLPRLDELNVSIPGPVDSQQLVVAFGSLPMSEMREGIGPAGLRSLAESAQRESRTPGYESAPSFWSTIATGFEPRGHGLSRMQGAAPRGVPGDLSALERNPVLARIANHVLPGAGLAVIHATDRRELRRPAFWEIAAHAGRSALVVNWWGSYPAVRHPRLRVASDRWMLRLWQGRAWAAADSSLRAPDDLAHQLGLRGDLLQHVFRFRAQQRSVAAGDSLLAKIVPPEVEGRTDLADAWSYATTADAFHTLLALKGAESGQFDSIVLMLNGLDILERRLAAGLEDRPEDRAFRNVAERLRQAYLRYLDELWRELQAIGDGVTTVLAAESSGSDLDRVLWSHRQRAGGAAGPRPSIGWAPLFLADLGLPAAGDMCCRTLPVENETLPTYGARPDWGMASGRHRVDLERLRSLGYIGR